MTEESKSKQLIEHLKNLKNKRHEILALPPEKSLDRILDDPRAIELVHSFPEQDLYFLIHDIGPEDALPIMSLASKKQWEHVVDLEVWQRDSIDNSSVTRWMNLLMEADPKRFVRWVLEDKLEFIEFYLFRNIEVRVREHDQDPSEFGKDFFSFDGSYYIRFIEMPSESETEKLSDDMRRQFHMGSYMRFSFYPVHIVMSRCDKLPYLEFANLISPRIFSVYLFASRTNFA